VIHSKATLVVSLLALLPSSISHGQTAVQKGNYLRVSTTKGEFSGTLLSLNDTITIKEEDVTYKIANDDVLSLHIRQGTKRRIIEGLLIGSAIGLLFGFLINREGSSEIFLVGGPSVGLVVGAAVSQPVWVEARLPP
jgi:hypothetical protein